MVLMCSRNEEEATLDGRPSPVSSTADELTADDPAAVDCCTQYKHYAQWKALPPTVYITSITWLTVPADV